VKTNKGTNKNHESSDNRLQANSLHGSFTRM
jgi:hypothetical protein